MAVFGAWDLATYLFVCLAWLCLLCDTVGEWERFVYIITVIII